MGRFAFALTSFTAALPAALLSAILVMAFTSQMEGIRQSFVLLLLVGITLGLSSFVVLIPFGIMVFGGPKKAKAPSEKAAKKKDKVQEEPQAAAAAAESATGLATDDSEAELLEMSSAEVAEDESVEIADVDSSSSFDAEELEETSAFSAPLSSPDFDVDAAIEDELDDLGEIEEIDDEIVLDDEDDQPKKKRR